MTESFFDGLPGLRRRLNLLPALGRLFWPVMLLASGAASAQVQISDLRVWHAPDHSRVVFDISEPVQYQLSTLSAPDRVVIDVSNARVLGIVAADMGKSVILQNVRHAPRDQADSRFVFDLRGLVTTKSFLLAPNQQYGHRLVVDFFPAAGAPATNSAVVADGKSAELAKASSNRVVAPSGNSVANRRKFLVVVDPGHGGEDPGATGKGGVREKDVVLQISRRLAAAINREPQMEAILTRDGDYFLPLAKRMSIARKKQADFFISVHANAYRVPSVKGAAVYSISQRGATSAAARALAERENASDLLGGVTLNDKDDLLASVLVDLSQSATVESSLRAARFFLTQLSKITRLHKRQPQLAGFVVLKAPDVPALLVETAFISNPDEERQLASGQFQDKLARSLVLGIKDYIRSEPSVAQRLGLQVARSDTHVVQPGDTLSQLASRYGVSLNRLQAVNPKATRYIKVGDTLHIPAGAGG